MKLSRIAATAAAAAFAATTFAAPASAQDFDPVEEVINTLDCQVLDTGLETVGAYEADHNAEETTRNELATNIRELGDDSLGDMFGAFPGGNLLKVQYSGQIADRALECGLVAENPQLPFGSSQILENLPVLEALSSELN